ncbi:MAG TPA: hypothetical protein VFM60_00355 [Salinimicrobium sp.]|nr:hypothetical protein [Salinimicrobium sp.]
MKEKKYIDRLYQEKFKDFEAAPREAVWESISSQLQKKERKRRILPLWYRVAGVAALITLILLIGDWFRPIKAPVVVRDADLRELKQSPLVPEDNNASVIAASREKEDENEKISSLSASEGMTEINSKKSSDQESTNRNKEISQASVISASGVERTLEINGDRIAMEFGQEKDLNEISGKSLFEEIKNTMEETVAVESSPESNIEISTFAAPVFYGNLGEGSFLDPQFNDNSSQSEITYSYGVQLAYALTENLKIRSGVSIVSMSYNTNGVEYHAVLRPQAISNVVYDKSQFQELSTQKSSAGNAVPVTGMYRTTVGSINGAFLNQKLGYFEVPVELEYNLVDKKIEINIIGGASTLFLNENIISVNTGDLTTKLGKAGNLNDISFSTNLGFGMDYNLSEKFKLNLEPVFKYQINTFDSSTGAFQPYYFAIYSGFTFQF